MSERRELVCDSCRRSIPLPTTPEAAATWLRVSRSVDGELRFIHFCGQCDHTAALKRFEERP